MVPRLNVIVHRAKEGGYWAEVEGLPGCITEADTIDELHKNVQDALCGWLVAQIPERAIAKPEQVKRQAVQAAWQGDRRREFVPLPNLALCGR